MPTLPLLIEEDIRQLDRDLKELLVSSEGSIALIIDKGGFLITHMGDSEGFELTTIAALASGAYMANQTIANLVHEDNFSTVYQQGTNFSVFVSNIDENCLLVVIFKASVGVGAVKYYAIATGARVARQLKAARQRDPDAGLDLSVMNLSDPSEVFRKKQA